MLLDPGDVLVEVDATVGKLAERSLPLELCTVFGQPMFFCGLSPSFAQHGGGVVPKSRRTSSSCGRLRW